jgi:hypothetical protein
MLNVIASGVHTGWVVGYTIGVVVVLVVVALVVPILVLARTIGVQAKRIDDGLEEAVVNTAALRDLETTIASANTITDGLRRGRRRLGG